MACLRFGGPLRRHTRESSRGHPYHPPHPRHLDVSGGMWERVQLMERSEAQLRSQRTCSLPHPLSMLVVCWRAEVDLGVIDEAADDCVDDCGSRRLHWGKRLHLAPSSFSVDLHLPSTATFTVLRTLPHTSSSSPHVTRSPTHSPVHHCRSLVLTYPFLLSALLSFRLPLRCRLTARGVLVLRVRPLTRTPPPSSTTRALARRRRSHASPTRGCAAAVTPSLSGVRGTASTSRSTSRASAPHASRRPCASRTTRCARHAARARRCAPSACRARSSSLRQPHSRAQLQSSSSSSSSSSRFCCSSC